LLNVIMRSHINTVLSTNLVGTDQDLISEPLDGKTGLELSDLSSKIVRN